MARSFLAISSTTFFLTVLPAVALAAPGADGGVSLGGSVSTQDGAEGEADAGASGEAGPSADAISSEPPRDDVDKQGLSKRLDRKWINRWAPEPMMGEVGVFVGALFPSAETELFKPDTALERQGQKSFKKAAFDVGARGGFYPLKFLGVEAEAAVMPSSVRDGSGRATLWGLRAHVVGQVGLWSITPFALVGAGVLSVASDRAAVGNDIDQSIHFGGGVKAYINRHLMVRIDIRNVLTPRSGIAAGAASNPEVLVGLSWTLGRKKDRPGEEPPLPAVEAAPTDRDSDGFLDDVDACPDTPGVAPDGCPVGDRDADGFADDVDACPDEAGVAPDGCPDQDPDRDGILGEADKCPNDPETVNGFEDDDGCPDELPDEIQKFSGTIEGIYFDVGKATIKDKSRKVLDGAVGTLKKFPQVRVEISGHTDSTGARQLNMDLSAKRAAAVKTYLVDKGVEDARVETRGAGPDEPIDSNASKAGRQNNRRIEFRILR